MENYSSQLAHGWDMKEEVESRSNRDLADGDLDTWSKTVSDNIIISFTIVSHVSYHDDARCTYSLGVDDVVMMGT